MKTCRESDSNDVAKLSGRAEESSANELMSRNTSALVVTKGGGPRTPTGKTRSKRNAVKHGILSQAVLRQESQSEYDSLARGLRRDLMPHGMLEEMLVEKLGIILWRYRRLLLAERAAIQEQISTAEELEKQKYMPTDRETEIASAAVTNDNNRLREFARQAARRSEQVAGKLQSNRLDLFRHALPESPLLESLLRYETSLERAFDRTLSQLERLQGIRLGQNVPTEQRVRMTLEP